MREENVDSLIGELIRTRRTEKVLCDVNDHVPVPRDIATRNRKIVLRSLEVAGWAPFHYPRNATGISEPWRAHVLWHDQAHRVGEYLCHELKTTGKEPRLCAACSALVLVTWLPEFYAQRVHGNAGVAEQHLRRDEEHLAATAAMVQNLLLMLTAYGMGTYWSSGGKLRESAVFQQLGIAAEERLLAAVFIEYPEMRDESRQRIAGKLRENRCTDWIREIALT